MCRKELTVSGIGNTGALQNVTCNSLNMLPANMSCTMCTQASKRVHICKKSTLHDFP